MKVLSPADSPLLNRVGLVIIKQLIEILGVLLVVEVVEARKIPRNGWEYEQGILKNRGQMG